MLNRFIPVASGGRPEIGADLSRYIRIGAYATGGVLVFMFLVPFASVPTGTRGVVTQFGAIQGIKAEGLAFVPPWQKLTIFNIRAEEADIKDADGSTADIQPVKVSLTVRYNITPQRVAEVYERYSHDGDLSSYVQTAAQVDRNQQCAAHQAGRVRRPGDQYRHDQFRVFRRLYEGDRGKGHTGAATPGRR